MNTVMRAGESSKGIIVRAWLTCLPASGAAEVAQLAGVGEAEVRRQLCGTKECPPPAAARAAGAM